MFNYCIVLINYNEKHSLETPPLIENLRGKWSLLKGKLMSPSHVSFDRALIAKHSASRWRGSRLQIYKCIYVANEYKYYFPTERGVVPLLDPSADILMRLGGRWSGRSLTLVLSKSLDGVYLSRLSVESDLSILTTHIKNVMNQKNNTICLKLYTNLLVRDDDPFLNIPVSLSLTVFFSFFRSGSLSKLRSDPLGATETLGIRALKCKDIQRYLKICFME